MPKITISKEQLTDFYAKTRLFGQHGHGVNKAIDVVVDPVNKRMWFDFTMDKKVVFSGPDLDEAIDLFNAV